MSLQHCESRRRYEVLSTGRLFDTRRVQTHALEDSADGSTAYC